MCTVSFIGDSIPGTWPKRYPETFPAYPTTLPSEVSRSEFDALKAEIAALRDLLVAAKRFDAATGQPDCEMDEKVALIKKVAELVGVPLGDVFGALDGLEKDR